MAYFNILSRHLPGGTKKKGKELQSGKSVSRLVFEVGTSGHSSRSVTGRVIVQAVNRQPLTAKIKIVSQVSLCGICRGQSVIEKCFSQSTSVLPRQYHSTSVAAKTSYKYHSN